MSLNIHDTIPQKEGDSGKNLKSPRFGVTWVIWIVIFVILVGFQFFGFFPADASVPPKEELWYKPVFQFFLPLVLTMLIWVFMNRYGRIIPQNKGLGNKPDN